MKKKITVIGLIITLLLLFWGYRTFYHPNASSPTATRSPNQHHQSAKRRSLPLAPVQVAVAQQQNIPHYLSALGTITPSQSVVVRSRVDGQLIALHFKEGQTVKQGTLLAEIDPRAFQIQLAQAKGQLAKDQASLVNAQQDLRRYQQLIGNKLVSQQQLDNQKSLVAQLNASIAIDQSQIDDAQLQLSYSRITAPISGVVGLKRVDVGNYITSGDTDGLLLINQMQPIDAVFTLPSQDISAIQQSQRQQPISIEAWDKNDKQRIAVGYLKSLDNQIDSTTGTIKLKARFTNGDSLLYPNQFVNIHLLLTTLNNALVIPVAAVQQNSQGQFVWLVDKQQQVKQQPITTGLQITDQIVVLSGLQVGDQVVTDGLDQLTIGAKVDIVSAASQATPAINQSNVAS